MEDARPAEPEKSRSFREDRGGMLAPFQSPIKVSMTGLRTHSLVGGVRAPRAVDPRPGWQQAGGLPGGGAAEGQGPLRPWSRTPGPRPPFSPGLTPRLLLPAFSASLACPLFRPAASSRSPGRPLPRPLTFTADTRAILRSALGAWSPARCRCSGHPAAEPGGDDQCGPCRCDMRSRGKRPGVGGPDLSNAGWPD